MSKITALTLAIACTFVLRAATIETVVDTDFTRAELRSVAAGGNTYTVIDMPDLGPIAATPGVPNLPGFVKAIQLPNGAVFTSARVAIDWQPFAAGVTIFPVQPPVVGTETNPPFSPPDPAVYGVDAFFTISETDYYTTTSRGVVSVPVQVCPYRCNPATKILEAAKRVTITVEYRAGTPKAKLAGVLPKLDYVLIAPPDYYSNWCDYVQWRASTRPGMTFLCKNALEIYEDFPFAGYTSTNGTVYTSANATWRNAAESIHAYLRDLYEKRDLEYAVLAGAWFDCQNPLGRYYGGEALSLRNAIPGLYVRSEADQPSDYFYACLDLCGGRYPWDKDENGVYGNQFGANIDISADIVVSRISFKPSNYVAKGMTIPQMIAAYTNKLARIEAPDFSGNHRFSMGFESLTATHDITWMTMADRDTEFKYFDGMYNVFDPRHGNSYYDTEMSTRLYVRDGIAAAVPLGEVLMNNAAADMWGNTELVFARSHGQWYYAAGHFNEDVGKQTGLTKVFAAQSPCLSGYPDYFDGGITCPCLAETFVQNPNGGSACSIAGGRVGYYINAPEMQTIEGDRYSKECEAAFFKNFGEGTNSIGRLWKTTQTVAAAKPVMNSDLGSRWCLYNQFLYGDPLVPFAKPEHYTANPDRRMNGIESAASALEISPANGNGGTGRLPVTFTGSRGTLTLSGNRDYYVGGVSNAAAVVFNGSNATIDLVQHADVDAITFNPGSAANTIRSKTRGQLAPMMPLDLRNAGAILETSEAGGNEPTTTPFAVLDGGSLTFKTNPNYGLTAGAWECILRPLEMKNGSTLAVDGTTTFALGSSAHPGTASFDIVGTNTWRTANGGAIKLCGTTEVTLNEGALLKIDANVLDNGAGKLVFNLGGTRSCASASLAAPKGADAQERVPPGAVEFVSPEGAGGTLEIGEGVTAILDNVPFAHLTNLVIGANAKIILPESDSDFWQIAPLQGCAIDIDATVQFFEANDLEHAIDGTLTPGGAFFRKGAVLEWNTNSGVWGDNPSYKPWSLNGTITNYVSNLGIYFGNLATPNATVEVEGAMVSTAASFANSATKYNFVRKAGDYYDENNIHYDHDPFASLVFTKLLTGGDFSADLPVATVHDIDVMGGEFNCTANNYPAVAASAVTIRRGASFGTTSLYSTIPSIRAWRVLFLGCNSSNVKVIELYTRIANHWFGYKSERNFNVFGGTMFDSNGSDPTNLGYLLDGKTETNYIPMWGYVDGSPCWSAPFTAGETFFGVQFTKPVPVPSYFNMEANPSDMPTRYQFQVTQDGSTWITMVDVNPCTFNKGLGGWGGEYGSFDGGGIWMNTYRHKTQVKVEADGALKASGRYYADITFEKDAVLKAVAGSEGLTLDEGSTFTWPNEGTVKIDTSDLGRASLDEAAGGGFIETALPECSVLIKGTTLTVPDFKHFTIDTPNAELRIVNGDLCVVAVDGDIQPPYLLGVCGTTPWNTDQWHCLRNDGTTVPFAKAWGEYNTKQSGEARLDLCGNAILDVDLDVVIDTVAMCTTNGQPSAQLTITSSNGSRLTAQTLDFSTSTSDVVLDIEGISGTIKMPGGKLVVAKSAVNVTLAPGANGKLAIADDFLATTVARPVIRLADTADLENLSLGNDCTFTLLGNLLYAVDLEAYRAELAAGNDPLALVLPQPKYNYEFEGNLEQTNNQSPLSLTQDGGATAAYVESRAGQAMVGAKHYTSNDGFQLGSGGWTATTTARLIASDNQVVFSIGRLSTVNLSLTSKSANGVSVAYAYANGGHSNLIEVEVDNADKQFHHYALRVDGAKVELFVDGVKRGEGALDEGHLLSGNTAMQFHSVHGGMPGGLGNSGTDTIALDNFTLYQAALGDLEVLKLSAANPVWPLGNGEIEIPEGANLRLSSGVLHDYLACTITGSGTLVLDTDTLPACEITLGDDVKVKDLHPATPLYHFDFNGNLDNTGTGSLSISVDSGTTTYVPGGSRSVATASLAADTEVGPPEEAATGASFRNNSSLQVPSSYTVVSVARPSSNANRAMWTLGGRNQGGAGVASSSSGKVKFFTFAGGQWHSALCEVEIPDATSTYHQYAMNIQGAALTFFVDGKQVGTGTAGWSGNANGNMRIHGVYNDDGPTTGLSPDLDGAIDDWAYYPTKLDPLKIRALVDEADLVTVTVDDTTGYYARGSAVTIPLPEPSVYTNLDTMVEYRCTDMVTVIHPTEDTVVNRHWIAIPLLGNGKVIVENGVDFDAGDRDVGNVEVLSGGTFSTLVANAKPTVNKLTQVKKLRFTALDGLMSSTGYACMGTLRLFRDGAVVPWSEMGGYSFASATTPFDAYSADKVAHDGNDNTLGWFPDFWGTGSMGDGHVNFTITFTTPQAVFSGYAIRQMYNYKGYDISRWNIEFSQDGMTFYPVSEASIASVESREWYGTDSTAAPTTETYSFSEVVLPSTSTATCHLELHTGGAIRLNPGVAMWATAEDGAVVDLDRCSTANPYDWSDATFDGAAALTVRYTGSTGGRLVVFNNTGTTGVSPVAGGSTPLPSFTLDEATAENWTLTQDVTGLTLTSKSATAPAPQIGDNLLAGVKALTVATDADGTAVSIGIINAVPGFWYGYEVTESLKQPFVIDVESFRQAEREALTITGAKRKSASAFFRPIVLPAPPSN